jgi:hypothetical protein
MVEINDFWIQFKVKSEWYEEPGTWKTSEPVSLASIIDGGMNTQIDFEDGGYVDFADLNWSVDEVLAEVFTDPEVTPTPEQEEE